MRRPRHAVRHHDQPLAHRAEHRPHQRVQPVLRVHAPRQLGVQPRQHQPAEVPRATATSSTSRPSGTPSRSCSPRRRSSSATPTTRPRRSRPDSRKFRQLGLGYANLGALLMAQGLPYDSAEGRAWAAAITALMTGHAYATSARTAGRMGPFAGYADNEDAMLQRAADAPRRGGRDRRGARARRSCSSAARAVVGRRGRARRALRRAQLAGHGARAHRHDRPDDGLRHHRHRARPRAHEGEEARRRRHDVHRQPDDPACAAPPRLLRRAGRGDRRPHRREQDDHRCARLRPRAPAGVRVLDGRQLDPLHGSRHDDGCGAAVHLGRDLEDRQHARGGDGRGRRGAPHRGVAPRPQGGRDLPRQLQGRSAALHAEEGGGGRAGDGGAHQGDRAHRRARHQSRSRSGRSCRRCGRRRRSRSGSPTATATSPSASSRTAAPARSS